MLNDYYSAMHNYLEGFVLDKRKDRLHEILNLRLDHIHVVLEDVYQAHNGSAVLRSCDCFGVQNVHFIENKNNYKISADVAMGATDWLSIHRHNKPETDNTTECLMQLKKQGYKIVATTPHTNDRTIKELNVDTKFALVFGTEIEGISDTVRGLADEFVRVPMFGFTESFNISVCASLCLYELGQRIRETVKNPYLTEEEKEMIYIKWLKNSIRRSDDVVKDFENRNTELLKFK